MAQPTSYDRQFSFSNFQAGSPSSPLPGNSVDGEFNAVKATLDATLTNLALIQRDDGALADDSVGLDQLTSEVTVGFNVPTVWVTATAYSTASTSFHGSAFYRCLVAHTSGVFATDLAAGKWQLIVDLSTIAVVNATQVAVIPAGNIASTTVAGAINELDAEKAPLSHTHTASAISDSTSDGRALLTSSLATQQSLLGITILGAQPGDIKPTAAITLQSGWYWCNGATKSRAVEAALFAAITITQTGTSTNGSAVIAALSDTSNMSPGMFISGTNIPAAATIVSVDSVTQITLSAAATGSATTSFCIAPHGIGNGTSTFNLPDYSGYSMIGRETMGAVTATNVSQVSTNITTTSGLPTATVASPTGLFAGMYVTAAKVPSGTRIASISGVTLTLTANATATAGPVAARFATVRDAQTLGAAGGELGHVTSLAETADHGHTLTDPMHAHNSNAGTAVAAATGSSFNVPLFGATGTTQALTGITLANSGGGVSHNNTPPSRVVNFVIKA